jgi:penicillin amidase
MLSLRQAGTSSKNQYPGYLQSWYQVTYGPAMRIIIDFADVDNALSVLPTGQSGNVLSDYYDDQAQIYADGKFCKMLMNKEDIEESQIGTLTLKTN